MIVKENNANTMHRVIVLLVFFISSGIYWLSIPALTLVLLYLIVYGKLLKISRNGAIVAALFFLSIGFSLFVGLFDQFGESAGYSAYLFLLFFSMITLIFKNISSKSRHYIYSYLFGSFLFYSIVITYACLYPGKSQCGYGGVYNIFTGSVTNTPGYANVLSIFPALGLAYIFICSSRQYVKHKILFFIIILFSLILLSNLASRASLVLLTSAFLISLILRKWKNVASSAVVLIVLASSVFVTLDYMIQNDFANVSFLVNRLQDKGFETQRVDRYMSGLDGLMKTPIGIYQIDPSVGENNLVHNIYLDLAKFGGWIVFVSFLTLSLLGFINNPFKQDESYKLVFVIYIVTLLSLQQDVFYGAGLPVLVIFLMCNTYLFCSKRDAVHEVAR